MAEYARVTSIDAMRRFKAALADFGEAAGLALSEAQSDVQRTVGWLTNDRMVHWKHELKRRTERLNLAKSELFRKQLESNDTRTSAVVERKNVQKAEALVQEAEQKIANVKRWKAVLERELMLFRAQCSQVSGVVSADVPATIARMDKMISSLEAYISIAAPTGRAPGSSGSATEVAMENVFAEPLPSEQGKAGGSFSGTSAAAGREDTT